MSSVEQRVATVTTNSPLHPALEGNGTQIAHGEVKQRFLFRQAVLVAAMVLAMTGWVYALGWVAIKLI
jgi:hypothetical protein